MLLSTGIKTQSMRGTTLLNNMTLLMIMGASCASECITRRCRNIKKRNIESCSTRANLKSNSNRICLIILISASNQEKQIQISRTFKMFENGNNASSLTPYSKINAMKLKLKMSAREKPKNYNVDSDSNTQEQLNHENSLSNIKTSFNLPYIHANGVLPSKESLTSRSRSKLLKEYLNDGLYGIKPPGISDYKMSDAMK